MFPTVPSLRIVTASSLPRGVGCGALPKKLVAHQSYPSHRNGLRLARQLSCRRLLLPLPPPRSFQQAASSSPPPPPRPSSSFLRGVFSSTTLWQRRSLAFTFPLSRPCNNPASSVLKSQLGALSLFASSPYQQQKPPLPPNKNRSNRVAQGAVGLIGAGSLLLGKTKYLLAALKVTKLASLGSMVVSIGAYSMVFGLPYATGIVGLILVHEAGHALVMHQRGIPFSPMVFLPFMGAVIVTKQQPRDAWEDALIAAGGPVAGSLGAGAVAVAAHLTDSQLLYALADFGFLINLFNLLPIGSMDGGRWAGALSKYVGVAGVGLGGVIAYNGIIANPLFYLIWLAGSYETFQKFYNPELHIPPNYYKISNVQRAALTTGYFGLIVALLAAMSANQQHKKSPERILQEQRSNEPTWDMR